MLNIYKSNKIEVISQLLAKELIISPPLITEKLDIAVPNYFLGKWLWDEITISNQISALYELKTISNYTEDLLKDKNLSIMIRYNLISSLIHRERLFDYL